MVRGDVDPRLRDRVEHAVGVVEAAVLQAEHALGDLADEEVEDEARRGVVRAVEEARTGHVRGSLFELF